MRIEKLSPLEITPLEAPHKRESVESLIRIYGDPNLKEALVLIPYVFVHYVKGKGLYMVDGHHRTGVAHLFSHEVNAVFLNTFKDLQDTYVLRDLGLIPRFEFNFPIEKHLPHFSRELPEAHQNYAVPRGVRTFDDFVEKIKRSEYYSTRPRLVFGV